MMTFVHLLCVNVTCVTLSCVDMLECVCVCTCGHWDGNVLKAECAACVCVCFCARACVLLTAWRPRGHLKVHQFWGTRELA